MTAAPWIDNSPAGGLSPARVDALIAQAHALRASDPAAALALCEGAGEMAVRIDYQHGLAHSLLRAGLCRLALPDGEPAALDALSRSVELFHSLDDVQGEAEACNLLANLHASRCDHAQALALYHRSLALRRRQGDPVGEAGALNNIGLVLRDTAQFADALSYLFMSQELAEAAADGHASAHALASIGAVLADLGDSGPATAYHLRALALLVDHPDATLEASTLTSLGRLLALGGHRDEALVHLRRALTIAHRSGQLGDIAAALLAQGLAHQQAGDWARAERLLLEALATVRRTSQRLLEADTLLALGRNRSGQCQPEAAAELLSHALQLAESLQADHLAAKLHEALSQQHETLGRFELALRHFRACHACEQRVHSRSQQRRIRALLGRADLERVHRDAEQQRRRGDELAVALDALRAADRQKEDLLAQLSQQTDMLRQLAREDGLTGLSNRRWLDAQLDRERERARRHGHPLALAMIDIDHFKAINDRCSHRVGDEVLRRVARLLRDACRSGDVVGRYGGEEFLVVLVETPLAAARGVCEKLRRLIVSQPWEDLHPELHRVSVSIGLAGDAEDPVARDLLQEADHQLYRAKREGRNRLCS
jgi:two-component system cell cycle response regulator